MIQKGGLAEVGLVQVDDHLLSITIGGQRFLDLIRDQEDQVARYKQPKHPAVVADPRDILRMLKKLIEGETG